MTTRETQQWEEELKAAGWKPLSAHPCSEVWCDPDENLYPGPCYAWTVMTGLKEAQQF